MFDLRAIKIWYMNSSLLSLFVLLFFACGSDHPQKKEEFPDFDFRYDLEAPDQTFKMPDELDEISGLGLTPDGKYLIAVQDEDGTIFYLNKDDGEVERDLDFWKDGDYEGVEVVGNDIFVIKSSGTLYRVRQPGEGHLKVDKFNQFLSGKNDVEGLGYEAASGRLLLSCKGVAGEEEELQFKKAVYAFNLRTMQIDSTPELLISLEDVQAYLGTSPAIRKLEKLMDYFSLDKSSFVFSPSGIAVHPLTGNYYITSSVGKLLMVVDPGGQILHIEKLEKEVHPQPEGIGFDTDGTMYIANEGKGGKGQIHRFRYRGT